MKLNRYVRVAVVLLTSVAMVAPTRCLAAQPVMIPGSHVSNPQSKVSDVRLSDQGEFTGQLRNQAGQPLIGDVVQLTQHGQVLAETTTRFDGGFAFTNLRPGTYQLIAGGQIGSYRVWQAAIAPPAAKPAVLVVAGDVARGQQPGVGSGLYDGAFMSVLSNPWVVTGLLAAGIAIPIAIANDDDSSGS